MNWSGVIFTRKVFSLCCLGEFVLLLFSLFFLCLSYCCQVQQSDFM